MKVAQASRPASAAAAGCASSPASKTPTLSSGYSVNSSGGTGRRTAIIAPGGRPGRVTICRVNPCDLSGGSGSSEPWRARSVRFEVAGSFLVDFPGKRPPQRPTRSCSTQWTGHSCWRSVPTGCRRAGHARHGRHDVSHAAQTSVRVKDPVGRKVGGVFRCRRGHYAWCYAMIIGSIAQFLLRGAAEVTMSYLSRRYLASRGSRDSQAVASASSHHLIRSAASWPVQSARPQSLAQESLF